MAADDRRQAWLDLARRQLRMATRLLPDFPDGAFFHTYHAFECALTAEMLHLAPGAGIPTGHMDKVDTFIQLCQDQRLSGRVEDLRSQLDHRNEALYVGWRRDKLRTPWSEFELRRVQPLLADVAALVEDLAR